MRAIISWGAYFVSNRYGTRSHRHLITNQSIDDDDDDDDDDGNEVVEDGKSTLNLGSISNLCSATLGAGALSLPYAISLTGIVLGTLLLLFSAFLTTVSIDVIISACVKTKLFKYEDVSQQLVGRRATRLLEASILIFCFGSSVAYVSAVGDILDQGIHSIPILWKLDDDGTVGLFASMYSRNRITIFFWAVVMFPLSLKRDVSSLEPFSPLGVGSIIFLVLAGIIHAIFNSGEDTCNEDSHVGPTDFRAMLWPDSTWNVIKAFPIIIFAFSCQPNVCSIYEELTPSYAPGGNDAAIESTMKEKQKIMRRIARNAMLLCVILYLGIGISGYIDFKEDTVDNILNNYCVQTTHDALMILASAFVAVAVVVAFPFNILPARVTIKLILKRSRRKWRDCAPLRSQYSQIASASSAEPHVDVDPGVANALLEFSERTSNFSLEGLQPNYVESPPLEHLLLTLFLSGSALVVALLIPGISVVFGLMGGTAASIICLVLPGMLLIESTEENGSSIMGNLMVRGGVIVMVVTTFVTIYGII